MTSDELFDHISSKAVDLKVNSNISATVFFNLTGSDPAQWQVRLEGGQAVLTKGLPENPDVTVTAATETALGLFQKTINPVMAFMTGKVKVAGDPKLLATIKNLIGG